MAEAKTFARPYAKAAFEIAKQADSLHEWEQLLACFAELVQMPDVSRFVKSPKLSVEQKVEILMALSAGSSPDNALLEKIKNFLLLLGTNNRLLLLDDISSLFEQYKASYEKTVSVELISARSVPDTLLDRLKDALKQKLGRNVELSVKTNAKLIGGAIIKAGDLVIDGSVSGQLNRLAKSLA